MDIAIHWGMLRHLGTRIDINPVATAIALDVVVLAAFAWVKTSADLLINYVSIAAIAPRAPLHAITPRRVRPDGRVSVRREPLRLSAMLATTPRDTTLRRTRRTRRTRPREETNP